MNNFSLARYKRRSRGVHRKHLRPIGQLPFATHPSSSLEYPRAVGAPYEVRSLSDNRAVVDTGFFLSLTVMG
jgi:hypothetical protein